MALDGANILFQRYASAGRLSFVSLTTLATRPVGVSARTSRGAPACVPMSKRGADPIRLGQTRGSAPTSGLTKSSVTGQTCPTLRFTAQIIFQGVEIDLISSSDQDGLDSSDLDPELNGASRKACYFCSAGGVDKPFLTVWLWQTEIKLEHFQHGLNSIVDPGCTRESCYLSKQLASQKIDFRQALSPRAAGEAVAGRGLER